MKKIISEKGAGLIEVLITVLLLATALLALSTLQARSLQFNNGSYLRSQANILAYDIIDRMRVYLKSPDLLPSLYNIDYDTPLPSGADRPSVDLKEWRTNVKNTIADAKGKIVCDASRVCTISIKWDEQNSSGDSSEDNSTFVYMVKL